MDLDFEQSEFELKPYVIPKNVKTRFEIFEGFGLRELAVTLITGIFGLCLGLIVWFIEGSPLWLGLSIPAGSIGFFFSRPNPRTGRNALDLMNDIRKFKAKPSRYYYRFGDGRGD